MTTTSTRPALTEAQRAELTEMAAGLRQRAADFDGSLERRRNTLVAHNTVIQTSPNLFLRHRDGVFGVGCLSGAVIFTREDAEAQLVECLKVSPESRAVPYHQALETEAAELRRIADTIEKRLAA